LNQTRRTYRFGFAPFCILILASLLGDIASPTLAGEFEVSRLSANPPRLTLSRENPRQQLIVTGHLENKTTIDLSRATHYEVSPPELATINASGLLSPRMVGDGQVRIRANGQTLDIPLTIRDLQPTRPVSYRHDVVPLLAKAGCNMGACHGNLNGKGGFRLSLRGDDPSGDWLALTRDASGRRTDLIDPARSLIFCKPTGILPHEGGQRFAPGSSEAQVFLEWISSGARDDLGQVPEVVQIQVIPSTRLQTHQSRAQQLIVLADFSDGTRRDVTRFAAFDVSDPTRAEVSPEGLVEVTGPVETTVAVRYLGARATSQLAFLADRPDYAWNGESPRNLVDTLNFKKLESLRINPSPVINDSTFLRRAYLDAVGRLPDVEEARAFLDSDRPGKRDELIDHLLTLPEFADFWALKWADLLRNEEKTMGSKGVWVFQRWLRDQIAGDVPLAEMTRRLVTGTGSTWSNPPASFYRTNQDPLTAAETVSQVFLGYRLQCARCHNHPFDVWTQDDYYGLAAFFGNVEQKELDSARKDRLDKHEINGDVFIYLKGKPETTQPRSGAKLGPKALGSPRVAVGKDIDALDDLADWLTRDNPQFLKNLTNRVWFHLLGRGIVEPVDDFRDSNPPSNPALLDALTAEFASNGTRLRPLVALIMKSKTYQLDSRPNESNAEDEANFARSTVRLLPAEVLLDSIHQALDTHERFDNTPEGTTAVQLPGARMGGKFLKTFGKPDRLLTCECERSDATTLAQAFQLINGDSVRSALENRQNRIGRLLATNPSKESIVETLYLAALSRYPNKQEVEGILAHVSQSPDPRKAWEDVCWAILNSKEFLLRR